MKLPRFFLFLSVIFFILSLPSSATSRPINDLSLEIPVNGGSMLMYSCMWPWTKHTHVGFFVGGGGINNDDTIKINGHEIETTARSIVVPFVGPRLTYFFNVIGVSVGLGLYHTSTKFEAREKDVGSFSDRKSEWSAGFYSPLLVLDFYDKKRDVVYGFGLGGIAGGRQTYEGAIGSTLYQIKESPVTTLTVHVSMMWINRSKKDAAAESSADDSAW